jgi:redox-sensitive bicupin YhaK (pirin superfamily)
VPENYPERALLVVTGDVDVNGNNINSFEMAICKGSEKIDILANQDSRLIIFGGETMGNRHLWWNFVSSSKERIDAAKKDWKYGRFGKVPGESEFIPLPENS